MENLSTVKNIIPVSDDFDPFIAASNELLNDNEAPETAPTLESLTPLSPVLPEIGADYCGFDIKHRDGRMI